MVKALLFYPAGGAFLSMFSLVSALQAKLINHVMEGSGVDLVLIHGLDSAHLTFQEVIPHLAKDFRVIAYDQRGHGRTPHLGSDYTNSRMAQDLATLLDHLEVERAHILGHSMGARTAVKFAALYPDRVGKVVVEDMEMLQRLKITPHHRESMIKRSQDLHQIFSDPVYPTKDALLENLKKIYSPQTAVDVASRRAREREDGQWELLFRPHVSVLYSAQANAEDLTEETASIEEVLILQAEYSSAISPPGEKQLQDLANTRIHKIEGSQHNIHGSRQEEFLKSVGEFL